ncbi:MAG: histidinol-phosphate transaminase, partial [Acidobacteria bacterium]
MKNIEDFVPAHIRALSKYVPGKPVRQAERESGIRCIKLASNENPFGPSPLAIAAIRQAATAINFYPDNDANRLRLVLAEHHGVEPEQILVTDGSTALIDIVARTLLAPGLNAVTSKSSFIIYSIVTCAAGGRLIEVPTRNDGFDLDAIASAITPDTRVVYIAELDRFIERVPSHVMVALDEAYSDYGEFYSRKKNQVYSRSIEWVKQRQNVIVLRTFSKAHGLAGLRVGYGIGDPQMLRYFAQMRTAFSVSTAGEAGAVAALKDETHIRLSVERNSEGVEYLTARLQELGFRIVPTTAN